MVSIPAPGPAPAPLFKIGDTIEGRFTEDDVWYPARIDRVTPEGKVSVTYTEYGNTEDLPLDRVRLKTAVPAHPAPVTIAVAAPVPVPVPAPAPAPAPVAAVPSSKWKQGQVVEARFSEDGIWYPASIAEVTADGHYLVVYTEYGNSEILAESAVRAPPGEHFQPIPNSLPPFQQQRQQQPQPQQEPIAKKSVNPPPGFQNRDQAWGGAPRVAEPPLTAAPPFWNRGPQQLQYPMQPQYPIQQPQFLPNQFFQHPPQQPHQQPQQQPQQPQWGGKTQGRW